MRRWFDRAVATPLPAFDGSLATARATADAFARLAKAANTRRAYRAGVAAWCAWCARHALPCLPASAADVVAFLAAERQRGLAVNTIDLRRAAIRYLHYLAGCAVPTAEAVVGETLAGIRRDAAQRGEFPAKKLAAAVGVLREILAPIGDDLRGRRDRALLLVGLRRRAAPVRAGGDPPGAPGSRPARAAPHPAALQGRPRRQRRHRRPAARHHRTLPGARAAPLAGRRRYHRRPAVPPHLAAPPARGGIPRPPTVGTRRSIRRTVARIVQARAAAAGFDAATLGGHSLKRGALTTGMDRGVHPARLKRLGRHRSYAVMDATSSTAICSTATRSAACSEPRQPGPPPLPCPVARALVASRCAAQRDERASGPRRSGSLGRAGRWSPANHFAPGGDFRGPPRRP